MLSRLFRRRDDNEQNGSLIEEEGQIELQDTPPPSADQGKPATRRGRITLRVWPMLGILALLLIIVGAATDVFQALPADLLANWPLVLIVLGGLWLLAGIVSGLPHGVLGGPILLAVGLVSMQAPGNNFTQSVLAGAVTLALGAAVFLRGLTMPVAD